MMNLCMYFTNFANTGRNTKFQNICSKVPQAFAGWFLISAKDVIPLTVNTSPSKSMRLMV